MRAKLSHNDEWKRETETYMKGMSEMTLIEEVTNLMGRRENGD